MDKQKGNVRMAAKSRTFPFLLSGVLLTSVSARGISETREKDWF